MLTTQKLQERVNLARDDRSRLKALIRLAHHFARAFRPREGLKAVREALALARKLKDERAKAEILAIATLCHYYRGDYSAAVATGLDAYSAFSEHDQLGRSHALYGIGLAFFAVCAYDDAVDAFRRAVSEAHDAQDSLQEGLARNGLGFALADSRRYEFAIRQFRAAKRLFQALGENVHVMKTVSNIGHAYRKWADDLQASGDQARSRRRYRHALRLFENARQHGSQPADDVIIIACIGEMHHRLGALGDAEDYFSEAARLCAGLDNNSLCVAILYRWARNACALEDFARADLAEARRQPGATS